MAVRLEGSIRRYIGTSADQKPTAEVRAGSSFMETDTGRIARYNGESWQSVPASLDDVAPLLMEVVALLADLPNAIALALSAG